jgi:peptidyl-prolyl cis-trans isomerase C
MHKTTVFSLAFALIAALVTPAALAQVAKVNGVTIPQARADALLREVTAQGRPDSPELRNMIKQELISREIMAQEAVKLGMNKNPEVTTQIELARQQVLAGAFLSEMARRNPANEEAMKAAYERLKDSPAANEYKAHSGVVRGRSKGTDHAN